MVARPCVFCRRQPAQAPWEPFCSERCKLQDLAKWVDGRYSVPGEPGPAPRDGPWDPDPVPHRHRDSEKDDDNG